jgi:hypothetical protein
MAEFHQWANPQFRGQGRNLGDFAGWPVVGVTGHDPSVSFSGRTMMGLATGSQYLFGTLRADDGRIYAPVRQFNNDVAINFMMYTGEEGKDYTYEPASKKAHQGLVDLGERDGKWGFWRAEPQPRCLYLSDEKSGHWQERGFLDLTGAAQVGATQVAVPDAESPLFYVTRCFLAEGQCMDQTVRGFVFHDTMFLAPNQGWTQTRFVKELELLWVEFATEFEDGSVHYGHLCSGAGNFAFGVVQRTDGPPVVTNNVRIDYSLDAEGFAESVSFDVGDAQWWDWTPTGNGGRMPHSPYADGPYWREGYMRPRGDTRKITASSCWMECYAQRLGKAS